LLDWIWDSFRPHGIKLSAVERKETEDFFHEWQEFEITSAKSAQQVHQQQRSRYAHYKNDDNLDVDPVVFGVRFELFSMWFTHLCEFLIDMSRHVKRSSHMSSADEHAEDQHQRRQDRRRLSVLSHKPKRHSRQSQEHSLVNNKFLSSVEGPDHTDSRNHPVGSRVSLGFSDIIGASVLPIGVNRSSPQMHRTNGSRGEDGANIDIHNNDDASDVWINEVDGQPDVVRSSSEARAYNIDDNVDSQRRISWMMRHMYSRSVRKPISLAQRWNERERARTKRDSTTEDSVEDDEKDSHESVFISQRRQHWMHPSSAANGPSEDEIVDD
jgi:hypothetical protein